MKKLIILIISFFVVLGNVQAKETILECKYQTESTSAKQISVLCDIYDNYSHQCFMQENGEATSSSNKESIQNWGKAVGMDFQAKEWVKQNNSCPPYLAAKAEKGINGYEIHAFEDRDKAFDFIEDRKNRYLVTLEGFYEPTKEHICEYENYTLKFYTNDRIGTTTSSERIYTGINVELENSDACPKSTYYGSCISGKCTILTKKLEGFQGDFQEAKLCSEDGVDTGNCSGGGSGGSGTRPTRPTTPEPDPDYPVTDTTVTSICANPSYRKPMKFIGTIVNFLKIIVPIVIIGFGILDLYKAVTANKDDGLKKAFKSIAIRVIAGVFIFLLPGIVQFILNMVNEWSNYKNDWCCCTDCILNSNCDVNSCSSDSCRIEGTN